MTQEGKETYLSLLARRPGRQKPLEYTGHNTRKERDA